MVLILVPVCTALGFWQMGRAEQKHQLQTEYDRRSNDAQVGITRDMHRSDELRFYKVVARGYYEKDYQFLVDNRILHGRPGYHVITPLRIGNSQVRVLVNRGWVPLGPNRERLPEVAPPPGLQEVAGIATVPTEHTFMLSEPEPLTAGWQPLWQQLDLKRFADYVPYRIQPVVILLAPESDAGGFTREWARLDAGIAIHQGYAFQWFALAAALVMIYIVVGLRGAKRDRDSAA